MAEVRAAVLGASGYTGADAIRLLLGHPDVTIAALGANTRAGVPAGAVWPQFAMYPLPAMVPVDAIAWDGVDVVFGCLPHGASAALLREISGPKLIDLSADFRLRDAAVYAEWYGQDHAAPELLAGAVYGLAEFARDALPGARLIACPGCYPTAVLLALLPLVAAGVIRAERISVTALSGVTGAGRGVKEANLFAELAESAAAYGLGRHRHMPEIEQELERVAGMAVTVGFTPHLVPMNRGELVTCTVDLSGSTDVGDLRAALRARYAPEPFVHVLADGVAPSTRMVRGSNHVVVNAFPDRVPGRALVVAAIDNLVKGSAGQAVQNMNVALGLLETAGLTQAPLFP